MKTIKTLCCLFAVLAFTSCSNTTEKTTTEEPPATTADPNNTTTIHTETHTTKTQEDPDHTEIGVDENGVKYSKKSGTNQTDVKIKTDSSSIIIRKRK